MITNVAASIRARLSNKAKASGIEFQFFLVRYACERFLYRLGACPVRDRFILKGATLLSVWMDEPYRATRDVDLLASSGVPDEVSVRETMKTICDVSCPEDGLVFDLDSLRISMIRSEQAFPSQRARLNCYLGSARILTQVDFGFGDFVASGAEHANLKTLIDGVPEPSLLVYPLSTSVAEKFEAMVRFGHRNSRMKDFHDVWALSDRFFFDGVKLRQAISDCFSRRSTDLNSEAPAALTSSFYTDTDLATRWRNYRAEMGLLTPPPQSFEIIGARLRRFLEPIHKSVLTDTSFYLFWPAGGPWQPVSDNEVEDGGSPLRQGRRYVDS